MEDAGQEINVIVNFVTKNTPTYYISTKRTCLLEKYDYLKLCKTGTNLKTELQCQKCSQSLKINLFWADSSDVVTFKVESNLDEAESFAEIMSPLKKWKLEPESDKRETLDVSDEHEESDPQEFGRESYVSVKNHKRAKTLKHSNFEESSINKCRLSKFKPELQLWQQELLNSEIITTNFELQRICDICGKPKGRRSTNEFLKHRASHFLGRKALTNEIDECLYYCLACNKKFQKTLEVDIHSRTCDQKIKLIERWTAKQKEPHVHIPNGVTLPELPNKKEGYFLKVKQSDGTIAYVEHLQDSKYTHVTNFNPRERQCDICQQPTKDAKSLRAHRKFHFFQLLSDETCVGCGETFTELNKRTRHTLYCKKKDSINPNVCKHCNHVARSFTKLRFHISAK